MLSAKECDAKVAEMVLAAAEAPTAQGRDEFLRLAAEWRHVSFQAAWQDSHPAPATR